MKTVTSMIRLCLLCFLCCLVCENAVSPEGSTNNWNDETLLDDTESSLIFSDFTHEPTDTSVTNSITEEEVTTYSYQPTSTPVSNSLTEEEVPSHSTDFPNSKSSEKIELSVVHPYISNRHSQIVGTSVTELPIHSNSSTLPIYVYFRSGSTSKSIPKAKIRTKPKFSSLELELATAFISTENYTVTDPTTPPCIDPIPPTLWYRNRSIFWDVHQIKNVCKPNILNINCTHFTVSILLGTKNSLNISTESKFQTGHQYNCSGLITMDDRTNSSKSAPILLPPGSGEIDITYGPDSTLSWTSPFENETLSYNVVINILNPSHYIPERCGRKSKNISFTDDRTEYYFNADLPDYNFLVSVSTDFWNFSPHATREFTTPSAAPGKPTNVSVKENREGDGLNYELTWRMPCDPNGLIGEFNILLSKGGENVMNQNILAIDSQDLHHFMLKNLTEDSHYDLSISAVSDKWGERENVQLSTFEFRPSVLNLSSYTRSTNFTIKWAFSKPAFGERNTEITNVSLEINPVAPRYIQKDSCPKPESSHVPLAGTETEHTYLDAWPFYEYYVSVSASTSTEIGPRANYTVVTEAAEPERPLNLKMDITDDGGRPIYGLITWESPCKVNGKMTAFNVRVTETYTEDSDETILAQITTNVSDYSIRVKPSHVYRMDVFVMLDDGTEGPVATSNSTTRDWFPGIPGLNVSDISNTSFVINYFPPEEKNGPILNYTFQIDSNILVSNDPDECPALNDSRTESGLGPPIKYTPAIPYSNYTVKVKAMTCTGYGEFNRTSFKTALGVPDKVRNAKEIISSALTEDYNASVTISFDKPCYTYGDHLEYLLEFVGTRDQSEQHTGHFNGTKSSRNFTFSLKLGYSYNYFLYTRNELYDNSITRQFRAPDGVPKPLNVSAIRKDAGGPHQFTITLRREYFNTDSGPLEYMALLISESQVNSDESFQKWNGTVWPSTTQRQVTENFWNPFENSDVEVFTIGNGTKCGPNGTCNEPLKDNTEYFLTIRCFNKNFYRDSRPLPFRTEKISRVGTILGILFGLLIPTILGVSIFFVWKKGIYRKLSYIYPKKDSIKNQPSTGNGISPRKFIAYFKNAENKPEQLKNEFDLLAEKSKEIQAEKSNQFSTFVENRRKNRYVNISPYDDNRVKLLIDEDDEIGSDYINASYIKGYSGNIEYIATQGPLLTTCRDFWKMIVQENVSIIVMVAQFVENSKDKCYKYFPNNHESFAVSDDIEIRCSTELHFGTYIIRSLQVRKDLTQVTVIHMQFLEWPDFGVPTGTEQSLQFIYDLRERVKIEEGLIVVHCSAGVGRTGTIIAADMLLQTVNAGRDIDIFNTVLELRRQRQMMVQTLAQYIYLHRLVAEHIDRPPSPDLMETQDPSYENMDILKRESQIENSPKREAESNL